MTALRDVSERTHDPRVEFVFDVVPDQWATAIRVAEAVGLELADVIAPLGMLEQDGRVEGAWSQDVLSFGLLLTIGVGRRMYRRAATS